MWRIAVLTKRIRILFDRLRQALLDQRSGRRSRRSLAVCGREIFEPKPMRVARNGNALNKAGRLVICGWAEGSLIKIYEAANIRHAEFIAAACKHAHLANSFPTVRVGCGRFLIANWSEDLRPAGAPVEALVELMHRIHQTPVGELPEPGFDYWHDYIEPRFTRAAELLDREAIGSEVIRLVSRAWQGRQRYVAHPDLTPRNVVLNSARRWQVIDNELLSVGSMPLLDATIRHLRSVPPGRLSLMLT